MSALISEVRSVSFDTSFLMRLDPAVDKILKVLSRDAVPCFVTGTVLSEIEQLKVWRRVSPGQYELAMARWRRVGAKPIDFNNRLLETEMGRRCMASMEKLHGASPHEVRNDCTAVMTALKNGIDVFLSEDWHLTSRVTDEVLREVSAGACTEYKMMCGPELHALNARTFLASYSRRHLDLDKADALRRDVRKPSKTMEGAEELKISPGAAGDLDDVWKSVVEVIERQKAEGIFQWSEHYPKREMLADDLAHGNLHVARLGGRMAGFVVLDEDQGPEWDGIKWRAAGKILAAHRLVVRTGFQGRGIGIALMDFAERFGREKGYGALRLDAYQGNPKALRIYEQHGYEMVGTFKFEHLLKGFNCYEKKLA
ncbi:MAG: GNAT family N-acetyltransferase [Methanobacteriota archaeon]